MIGLCLLAIMIRSAELQIFPYERLSQLKKRLFTKTLKIKSRRGIIYDREGRELAISIPSLSLFADPQLVEKPYFVAKKLSQLLGKPKKTFLKLLQNKKRRFIWIKHHLEESEIARVKSWNLKGLYFIKEPRRFYTHNSSLSQVLGFTGVDNQGLEGIEKQYDHILKSSEQKIIVKRDARGRPLFADFSSILDKVSGFNIYLTIDSSLQFYLEKELHKAIKKSSASKAVGVILDVNTSEILAMANIPNYNPNQPFATASHYRRNRVVTDIYEPGSTLKTFTIAAALEKGIPPYKTYSTEKGSLELNGATIQEADTKKKFKSRLNLSEILGLSSNVGAAQVALDVSAFQLRDIFQRFGFGQKTLVDFPGEASGILRKLPWRNIETATISFGHGVATTALQIANAYNAIANGGILNQPLLVKKIKNPYTGDEKIFKSKKIRRVISPNTARVLKAMLTEATDDNNTGFRARVSNYLSAGKTGTAQTVDLAKGGYKKDEYISSFSGFIPSYEPKFVIYVAIDGAKDNFYASYVAAPIFSSTGSYLMRRSGISPSILTEKDFIPSQVEIKQASVRKLASADVVPDLRGLTLRQALAQLKQTGTKVKVKGSKKVIRSHPAQGEKLPLNKQITLILN